MEDDVPLVNKSPASAKDALTFGIELEFALATLKPGAPDLHLEDERPVHGLAISGRSIDLEGNVRRLVAGVLDLSGILVEAADLKMKEPGPSRKINRSGLLINYTITIRLNWSVHPSFIDQNR